MLNFRKKRKSGNKKIETILIADNNGEVITRIPVRLQKSDNIYSVTKFGSYIKRNSKLNSVIEGKNRSLMLAAGKNIENI